MWQKGEKMIVKINSKQSIKVNKLVRDLTAHKYQTLRMEDVYNTVIVDFGSLKKQLENVMSCY